MALTFGSNLYNTEKNRLSSANAWIHLLEIEISPGTFYRIVDNNETIVYNGENYDPLYFNITQRDKTTEGKIQNIELSLRINPVIASAIDMHNGFENANIILMLGQTKQYSGYIGLLDDLPAIISYYKVLYTHTNDTFAIFKLGLPNLNLKKFPSKKYYKNHCAYNYEGSACGYTAPNYVNNTFEFSLGTDPDNDYISDSSLGFDISNLPEGSVIQISGSNSNDGFYTVVTAETGMIRVSEDLVTEHNTNSIILKYFATCDKSFPACILRNNSNRYGGYPSMPYGNIIKPQSQG